jgi:voltage-gated potassium channel Kch
LFCVVDPFDRTAIISAKATRLEPSITLGRPLIDYFYYEIITFTTVGYGDIIPATAQGKLLAICTALLGATHGVTFVALVLQALNQPPPAGR